MSEVTRTQVLNYMSTYHQSLWVPCIRIANYFNQSALKFGGFLHEMAHDKLLIKHPGYPVYKVGIKGKEYLEGARQPEKEKKQVNINKDQAKELILTLAKGMEDSELCSLLQSVQAKAQIEESIKEHGLVNYEIPQIDLDWYYENMENRRLLLLFGDSRVAFSWRITADEYLLQSSITAKSFLKTLIETENLSGIFRLGTRGEPVLKEIGELKMAHILEVGTEEW